jgi:hypothetical protein
MDEKEQQKLQTHLLLPPMKGLNDYDNPFTLDPSFAKELENFMPPTERLQLRPGSKQIGTLQGFPQSIIHYSVGAGMSFGKDFEDEAVTFAVEYPKAELIFIKVVNRLTGNVNLQYFDLSAYGDEARTWQVQKYPVSKSRMETYGIAGRTLVVLCGDINDTGYIWHPKYGYRKLVWTAPVQAHKYSGQTLAPLANLVIYNGLAFANIEGDTTILAMDARAELDIDENKKLSDEMTESVYKPEYKCCYDVTRYCQEGGYILYMFTMGMPIDNDVNNYLCVMTSKGELLLFSGKPPVPEDAAQNAEVEWLPKSVVRCPIPLNSKCMCKTEDDVIVASRNGFYSLKALILNQRDELTHNLEYRVKSLFTTAVFKQQEFVSKMFLRYDFDHRLLIFNMPNRMPMEVAAFTVGTLLYQNDKIVIEDQISELEISNYVNSLLTALKDSTFKISMVYTNDLGARVEGGLVLTATSTITARSDGEGYNAVTKITFVFYADNDNTINLLGGSGYIEVDTTHAFDKDQQSIKVGTFSWNEDLFGVDGTASIKLTLEHDYEITNIYEITNNLELPDDAGTMIQTYEMADIPVLDNVIFSWKHGAISNMNGKFVLPDNVGEKIDTLWEVNTEFLWDKKDYTSQTSLVNWTDAFMRFIHDNGVGNSPDTTLNANNKMVFFNTATSQYYTFIFYWTITCKFDGKTTVSHQFASRVVSGYGQNLNIFDDGNVLYQFQTSINQMADRTQPFSFYVYDLMSKEWRNDPTHDLLNSGTDSEWKVLSNEVTITGADGIYKNALLASGFKEGTVGSDIGVSDYYKIWGTLVNSIILTLPRVDDLTPNAYTRNSSIRSFPFFDHMFYSSYFESEQYVFNTVYGTWAKWTGLNMVDALSTAGTFYFARAIPIIAEDKFPEIDWLSDVRWCVLDYDSGLDTIGDGDTIVSTPITSKYVTGFTDFGIPNMKQALKVSIHATAPTWLPSSADFTNDFFFLTSVDFAPVVENQVWLADNPTKLLKAPQYLSDGKSLILTREQLERWYGKKEKGLKNLKANATLIQDEIGTKDVTLNLNKPFRRFSYGITLQTDQGNVQILGYDLLLKVADK